MDSSSRIPTIDLNYQLKHSRTETSGRFFLTGTQALTRMLIMQRKADQDRNLKTAGFVSGYRGSPLAGVDIEMWRSGKELAEHGVKFLPAVNEDLAATAMMGTQQAGLDPGRKVDGVFAMWYGKSPGVDRSGDALRHGNAAGTSRHGGVLVVVGDDHAATSSSLPNASDLSLMGWGMPIIHPASVDEYVEFGLWGWAASRFSSTWVAFKAVSETVESGRSIDVPAGFSAFQEPEDFVSPVGSLEYSTSDVLTAAVEVRLAAKLEAIKAFARRNPIDKLVVAAPGAKLGIVAVGKAYHDLMEVLQRCGMGLTELAQLKIRLYKPGLTFPLEPAGASNFCRGLQHVLVIEEKASVVEQQLKELVFNDTLRPTIAGKSNIDGTPLITWLGQLRPALLAPALQTWLGKVAPTLAPQIDVAGFQYPAVLSNAADGMRRLPYFCSGCPHNSSTKVPEGSQALAGIGCHYMASWMDRNTGGVTQMGGEGADWIGKAPFTSVNHVFQNLGDGTYFHSGYMAIRQAIAVGVNITYKILFNDAVAMTGGQSVDGNLTVPRICEQMTAEGAKRITVVTDYPANYVGVDLAPGIQVHHRRDLDAVQRELRDIPGVTVLIYDQTCAAEKRRRRKRGDYPDPQKRMFINTSVCEGCGDCGIQSNCLSIAPVETVFGRKRQIDQSSCNKDYSCVTGFCPSFVTVIGRKLKETLSGPAARDDLDARITKLPYPELPSLNTPYNLMVAGVGGTGVITIGALLAMAAHLDGIGTSVLDFTAVAQKGGSVTSHVRFARGPDQLHAVRLEWGQAHAVIVADLVVGVVPDVIGTIGHGRTKVVANTYLQTLAEFTRKPDLDDHGSDLLDKLKHAAGAANCETIDANGVARAVLGDAIGANVSLMGYAWQRGWIPVSLKALDRAIELNGVAVDASKRALSVGRLAAHDAAWLESLVAPKGQVVPLNLPVSLEKLIERGRGFLTAYQSEKYAGGYVHFVRMVEQRERACMPEAKRLRLTEAVARCLFKLMAYKDEYEVARLYARPQFMAELREQFEGDYTLRFNLAPPLFAKRNAKGELMKSEFGPWMFTAFKMLSALRGLRGTPLDIMGYTAERKQERRLIGEYKQLIERLLENLTEQQLPLAVQIAERAEKIRGYGHIKERNRHEYEQELAVLLDQYRAGARARVSAKAA